MGVREKGLGGAGREYTEEEDYAPDEEHQGGDPDYQKLIR